MSTSSEAGAQTRAADNRTGCIVLVGMAGAGKSTLGRLLAATMRWERADTDHIIEATYGLPLQTVLDTYGLEAFLRIEESTVAGLGLQRTVISTGGSVIYGPSAVARLKTLGAMVHLRVGLPAFLARVGDGRGRGLAVGPGQSFESLYAERMPLYEAAADFTVDTDQLTPEQCVQSIVDWVERSGVLETRGLQQPPAGARRNTEGARG